MERFTTAQDVKDDIAAAIESNGRDVARAEEFDLDAILDEAYEYRHVYDEKGNELVQASGYVQAVDTDEFWTIVMRHALTVERTACDECGEPATRMIVPADPQAFTWPVCDRHFAEAQAEDEAEAEALAEPTTKRTVDLVPGDRIRRQTETDRIGVALPLSLEHPGEVLTVARVDEHVITAGRYVGQVARDGRRNTGERLLLIVNDRVPMLAAAESFEWTLADAPLPATSQRSVQS